MITWSTACPDWEDRIRTGKSLVPFDPLFPAEAQDALRVFNELKVVDVHGTPPMGEIAGPWVRDFVSAIFGSYDPDAGRRLITEFFLLISKKNAKSTTAAEIMLTLLIRNWRQSAEFLILAPTVEVANNSFYPARDSIRADDELRDLMHIQEHVRSITHRITGATLKVVAAENESVSGRKSSVTLIEELWLFGKRANAENILREATGGLASRPEGCTIYLTTQSDEPPAGVFRTKLMYARKVRDGEVHDPSFLPVLYEFPKAMIDAGEHLAPENFHITNPNIGGSVSREFLTRELAKAQEDGPSSLAGFLAKHLNVEIGLSLRSDRWAGADHWQKCAVPRFTLDDVLRRSEVIDIGIDGGGLDDLLGLAVMGRDSDGKWLLWTRAWAHPEVLQRRKSEAPRFQDFAKDGDLIIVNRIGEDVSDVAELCARVEASGLLDKIGVDPHGLGGILDALMAEGIPEEKIVGVSQGWKLTGAIKTLERKLAEGQVEHGGQALMTWSVGNAKVEPRGNAISITKQAAGFAKIDPVMAAFDCTHLMSLNPTGGSIYNKRGVYFG